MKPMLWILSGIAAVAVAVDGCKGKEQSDARAPATGQQGMASMKMDSMPTGGDHMGVGGPGMMPKMRARMDSMLRMSPERLSAMVAGHDRMMSGMMDRMGADMRGMNMSADAGWNALVDSVKADLADLSGLQGPDLRDRMKAHVGRVARLMAMHEAMMAGK